MTFKRSTCHSRLCTGMALIGCLCIVICLAGCQLSDSKNRGGLKDLLRDGSANEQAIRKAAIEDTAFPSAAEPIPRKS
ncbi:MAG: hypothetical protein OES79_03205 [Planctomycetota bacterium]|nr:hypothetical protein [Planctomycetota bacterium]